jgi:hypothetical protein
VVPKPLFLSREQILPRRAVLVEDHWLKPIRPNLGAELFVAPDWFK